MFEKTPRMFCPIVEIGSWAEETNSDHARIVGTDTDGNRSAGVRSDQNDSIASGGTNQVRDGMTKVVDPALQREVTLALAAAPEVEGHGDATQRTRHAIHQLRECAA